MSLVKLFIILLFVSAAFSSCFGPRSDGYVITGSKDYSASLFRQHCAICHGAEAEGKILADGTEVPSLRTGAFKMTTESEIYRQISEGGNGMTPFSRILTERELRLMTKFVHDDLRRRIFAGGPQATRK